MKHILYSYKFFEEQGIGEQLDEFNKLLDDLENLKVIMLLNALPKCYEHLMNAMLFGRESTTQLKKYSQPLEPKS